MKNKLLLIFAILLLTSCEDTVYVVNKLNYIEYDSTFVYELKYKWNDDSITTIHRSSIRLEKGTIID